MDCESCLTVGCAYRLPFRWIRFLFRSYDTLALHALVDDTIEKTTAVVTEGGAVVRMLLELVLRPCVLRYYTITPCTHTQTLGSDDDDDDDEEGGNYDRGDVVIMVLDKLAKDRWISQFV